MRATVSSDAASFNSRQSLLVAMLALLFCLAAPDASAFQFDIKSPSSPPSGFGGRLTLLPNGNFLVIEGVDTNFPSTLPTRAHLYTPSGALIATTRLVSNGFDGGKVTVLTNGNVVVSTSAAVTLINGVTGFSGTVSASNSLLVPSPVAQVIALPNGNYAVWVPGSGIAVGDGRTGLAGIFSASNALAADSNGPIAATLTMLADGDIVVGSPAWNSNTGAATLIPMAGGLTGNVGSGNSLVGSAANDGTGSQIAALANGGYVVASNHWQGMGAATWAPPSGVTGTVSAANSLVGASSGTSVLNVVALTNGNYVVLSATPASPASIAATWCPGTGCVGPVSISNSIIEVLTGGRPVGQPTVSALDGGNYVLLTPDAAVWGDGSIGTTGSVSDTNAFSLQPTTLVDLHGYYAIFAENDVASQSSLTIARSNAASSTATQMSRTIIGGQAEHIGSGGIVPIVPSNVFAVVSPHWNNARGAVTFVDAAGSFWAGPISSTWSIVGANANDAVGSGGVAALDNGTAVIASPQWENGTGAVTILSKDMPGAVVGPTNSLIGATAGDQIGSAGVTALTHGRFVIASPNWDSSLGAVTLADAASAIGSIGATNSMIGSSTYYAIGGNGVTVLPNGNFVVHNSAAVSNQPNTYGAGEATWGNATTSFVGTVSPANSFVDGTDPGVGSSAGMGSNGIYPQSDSRYVIVTRNWFKLHDQAADGAISLLSGTAPSAGMIDSSNSVLGAGPQPTGYFIMPFIYDPARGNLIVGRPGLNLVTILNPDRIFANGFE